jgi:hypothetical protein
MRSDGGVVSLLQITLECTWELPHKMPYYGTLVSLRSGPPPPTRLCCQRVSRGSALSAMGPPGWGRPPLVFACPSIEAMPGLTHSLMWPPELTLGPPLSLLCGPCAAGPAEWGGLQLCPAGRGGGARGPAGRPDQRGLPQHPAGPQNPRHAGQAPPTQSAAPSPLLVQHDHTLSGTALR